MPPAQMVREGWVSSHPGLGHWILLQIKSSVGCPGEGMEDSQCCARGLWFLCLLPLGPPALFLLSFEEASWKVRMKTDQTRTSFLRF